MAADSILTTVIAVTLVVGGMVAALGRHRGSSLRDSGGLGPIGTLGRVGMLGTGAIMLGALVIPDFSHFAATTLTGAVLLMVLAGVLAVRIRRQRPLGHAQKTAVAVTVADIAFMSATVLLMPVHSAAAQLAQPTSAAQPGRAHAGSSHLILADGMMIWLVLVVWAFCAVVLSLPAILRRSTDGVFPLVCSGCMITAMAVMAV